MHMVREFRPDVARRSLRLLTAVALVTGVASVTACEKSQLLAPTNSSLSVSAALLIVPAGGNTTVEALVMEQAGTPVHNGTTVRFTTSLGRVDPVEAQTRNGVATTTFFADGASGVADIRATSGAASGGTGTTLTNVVQIRVGSTGLEGGSVTVRANPGTVPAAGGTVEIIASVVGEKNAVLPGVLVSFTANRGTLSAPSALTNAAGEARVQLTTNRETVVTAAVGAQQGTVTVNINPPATVTLVAGTALVGQPTTLRVTPTAGTAPRVVVAWGDGTDTDLGIVATERTITHVYGESGSYTILATSTDNGETYTNSVTVTVAPRPSPTIAGPSTGTAGTALTFTVTAGTGGAGLRNVKVDFGDGTVIDLGTPAGAVSVSHTFSAGTHTVRAIQSDGSGAETIGTIVVTVN